MNELQIPEIEKERLLQIVRKYFSEPRIKYVKIGLLEERAIFTFNSWGLK